MNSLAAQARVVQAQSSPRDKTEKKSDEPFDVVLGRERVRNTIDKEFLKTKTKMWKACHAAVMELRRTTTIGREKTETVRGTTLRHLVFGSGSVVLEKNVQQSLVFHIGVHNFFMYRIDTELGRRVDLCFLVCGKVCPNDDGDSTTPADPIKAPGCELGNDIDLPQVLLKLNTDAGAEPSAPQYTSLEDAIAHATRMHPLLPIESYDVPSLQQLEAWSQKAASFNTQDGLDKHVWDYAKKEELVLQLVSAMSQTLDSTAALGLISFLLVNALARQPSFGIEVASLRCVKCRLIDETQHTRHLRDGESWASLRCVKRRLADKTQILGTCATGSRCVNRRLVNKTLTLGTCATESPAAFLRCVKLRLVDKTQYTAHLRDGECNRLWTF